MDSGLLSVRRTNVAAMTTWTRAEIGALGEQLAVEHLTSLGLEVLDRNWRCRYGELDVIAADRRRGRLFSSRSRRVPATGSVAWRRRSPRTRSAGCAGSQDLWLAGNSR